MGSVGGVPASQAVSGEIRDCSGKQYEPINTVERTHQVGIAAISSDCSTGRVSLLGGKVTNPELCLNKASFSFAKRIAKWSCESAQGTKGKIQSAFKRLFECLGIIKTIHRDESRKQTPIKWGGQVFTYENYEDYSGGGVSGKKITLKSEDTSESLTFNTAVDSFYRVGDYVVINRRECKEDPRPDEPDGRTSILGIDKFKEILGKAGSPEVRYKSDTDMAGEYGPKDVMEQIGPQIFEETRCLILNSDVIYPDELEGTKTFLNKETLGKRDGFMATAIHWPEIRKPYDLFVRLFLPDSEQSTVKFDGGAIKIESNKTKNTLSWHQDGHHIGFILYGDVMQKEECLLPKTQFTEVPESIGLSLVGGERQDMNGETISELNSIPLTLSLEAKKGYLVIWDDRFYAHRVKEGGFEKRVLLWFGLLNKKGID